MAKNVRNALVVLLGTILGMYLMTVPFAAPAYAACPLSGGLSNGFYGMNGYPGMNDSGYGKLHDFWGSKFGRHGQDDFAWRMAAYRQYRNQQTGCVNGNCATDCTNGKCDANCTTGDCNNNCPSGNCNTDCTTGQCQTLINNTCNSTCPNGNCGPECANSGCSQNCTTGSCPAAPLAAAGATTPIDTVKTVAAVLGFDAANDTFTLSKQCPTQAMVEVSHNGQLYSLTLSPAADNTWQITSMNQSETPVVVSQLTNEVKQDLENEVKQDLNNEVKQELGEAKA